MRSNRRVKAARWTLLLLVFALALPASVSAQRTAKPVLHGKHWVAITGKPLGATAGAMIFQRGGNAVDAACAMLGATSTMWDTLGWGGETQALIYNPNTEEVIGINGLGVAPTGATPEFFKQSGYQYPPAYGPLAAVTPGTPGALMVMLAKYGTMSLEEVLAPSIEMADGYPIEASQANNMERNKERIKQWKYSTAVYLPHLGEEREAPYPGEVFRQPWLAATLRKLVEAEQEALSGGMSREEAIMAAYDRFYRGDIAEEIVRGTQEEGGQITMADLDGWQVYIEEPVKTNYKGIDVYKLTTWVQGPVMLQALNILENFDLEAMGYNSARYIHTIYQTMNLAFADRDFYYGDPYFAPDEPIDGLLSKEYAKHRAEQINWEMNDPNVKPGDPYPYQGGTNPFLDYLEKWGEEDAMARRPMRQSSADAGDEPDGPFNETFYRGTTSIQAADEEGWIVSVTPSGAWIPAVVAGETGIGLSQRAQSFVLDPAENPYNVIEPGKRPRATLTPSLALKDGRPYLSFSLQGGDAQDQNLLQLFLNIVEWGMNVQQATEAPNINSSQMKGSFGQHDKTPGGILIHEDVPPWVQAKLRSMGYTIRTSPRTSGPLNAIWFDWEHGTMWGGSSNHGEDYGIAW
jgi:gamma-glutamyltranspeptidase/glutathione hydrolase